MRYSTIHHDVRERFDLTLVQYLVCDSIHQLSHGQPTTKTDTEISEFLGVDRSYVGASKKILVLKKLIIDDESGAQTTQLWTDAVTFAAGKIPEKRGKSPPYLI